MRSAALWDRRWIYAAVALRSFGFGFASVLLGVYLQALGFSPVQVGVLLTVGLAGGSVFTLAVSLWGDRLGRRRSLLLLTLVMVAGATTFALSPVYGVMVVAALTGAVNPTGRARGALSALDQSLLGSVAMPWERSWVFARYNLIGTAAGGLGALASGGVTGLRLGIGLEETASFQAMFLLFAGLLLAQGFLYWRLSPGVEAPPATGHGKAGFLRGPSRRRIAGLSGLFALDSFGGGLVVQSFLSYWFHLKFGLAPETLGAVFFASGVLTSLSYLAAARLAQRIGLLNTMVFSHLPANGLMMLVPFMPTVWTALGVYFLREALSQMDVPTRQSYTMGVVSDEERTEAAALTTLSRNVAQSVSPSLGGVITATLGLASPFLVAGGLKAAYDIALLLVFRRVKLPEEAR